MTTVVLDDVMSFTYPLGFHVLEGEELEKMNYYKEPPKLCIQDPERHMIVSVAWEKPKGLFGKLADSKDVEEVIEGKIKKMMKPYGYDHLEDFTRKIDRLDADGFRYSYTAQGIKMMGEVLTIKREKTSYYIYGYYREELKEDSIQVMKEIYDSISWPQPKDGAVVS